MDDAKEFSGKNRLW